LDTGLMSHLKIRSNNTRQHLLRGMFFSNLATYIGDLVHTAGGHLVTLSACIPIRFSTQHITYV